MVKLTRPCQSQHASGTKAGLTTFAEIHGQAYAKRHSQPTGKPTAAQLAVRAETKLLQQLWTTLTKEQQATWQPLADMSMIQRINAYLRENWRRHREGLDPTPVWPPATTPAQLAISAAGIRVLEQTTEMQWHIDTVGPTSEIQILILIADFIPLVDFSFYSPGPGDYKISYQQLAATARYTVAIFFDADSNALDTLFFDATAPIGPPDWPWPDWAELTAATIGGHAFLYWDATDDVPTATLDLTAADAERTLLFEETGLPMSTIPDTRIYDDPDSATALATWTTTDNTNAWLTITIVEAATS